MKKRILAGVLLLTTVLALFSGCSSDKAADKPADNGKESVEPSSSQNTKKDLKKINIGYLASPGHVLYFVAKEKGFFEEEGLDAELFLFTNSGEGLNAINAGKVDVGSFGTAAPLTFISKGTEFTIFGGQQTEGHGIIATPEKAKELTDLNSFKGKTIATVRLATGDVVFRGSLTEAGIDWKNELTINELDSPAAVVEAVKKGSVDAGIVWTPFIKLAEKQGLQIVKYSGDLVGGHTCCRQVALTSKIKENPDFYQKFVAALIRAYKFYVENQDETIDIMSKYVKVDKDILKAETYGGHIHSVPDPDKEGVEKFWELIKKSGYITSDLDINDFIDTTIYKNALDEVIGRYPDDEVHKKLKAEFTE